MPDEAESEESGLTAYPFGRQEMPVHAWISCAADTVSVSAFGPDVEFGLDTGLLHGGEPPQSVLDADAVILSLGQEHGWSPGIDEELGVE